MPKVESPGRPCARCGRKFSGDELFVTCSKCRIPLANDGGGCNFWVGIEDVRVTKVVGIQRAER